VICRPNASLASKPT